MLPLFQRILRLNSEEVFVGPGGVLGLLPEGEKLLAMFIADFGTSVPCKEYLKQHVASLGCSAEALATDPEKQRLVVTSLCEPSCYERLKVVKPVFWCLLEISQIKLCDDSYRQVDDAVGLLIIAACQVLTGQIKVPEIVPR